MSCLATPFELSVIVYKFNNIINCIINILFNSIFCCSFLIFNNALAAFFTYDNSYRNTDKVSVFELNAGSFVSVVKQYFYSLCL